jgi:hypothetical protein
MGLKQMGLVRRDRTISVVILVLNLKMKHRRWEGSCLTGRKKYISKEHDQKMQAMLISLLASRVSLWVRWQEGSGVWG